MTPGKEATVKTTHQLGKDGTITDTPSATASPGSPQFHFFQQNSLQKKVLLNLKIDHTL